MHLILLVTHLAGQARAENMYEKERSLDATSTWAVAVVCLFLVSISLLLEHGLHGMGKWLKKLQKPALVGALNKVKTGPISEICISPKVALTWLPCERKAAKGLATDPKRRLLAFEEISRRELAASAPIDKCSEKGKVAFVSAYGIHQLHYFIFVLAIVHVFYCIVIYILGRSKMRKWKLWEDETKNRENDDYNDPERSRVAKDTSFGRRHLTAWSQPRITLWIVCFFRQFMGSVTRVDYRTLRHGFIMAHFAPGSENRFDFQNYINRTLKDDFKEVVSITPTMWVLALFCFLANTHGLYKDFWLPFVPLVVLLVVGTKLQMIITRMGLRIQEKGDVIKGKLVVEPGDDLFWFRKPRLIFINVFQLAFFIWGLWKFGIESCLHASNLQLTIKIIMCVVIQVLCCYVTLPLYALVSQMGSGIRPTIFNDRVATALRNWHQKAKKRVKDNKYSESVTSHATFSNSSTPRDSWHCHQQCKCDRSLPNSEPNSPKRSGQDGDATPDFEHSHRREGDPNVRGDRVMPLNEITADADDRRDAL